MKSLDNITLAEGSHISSEDGLCLMEAVAYFAGEEHSDTPACASEVLTRVGINLNDALPHVYRQKLKPLIPRIVGTRNDGLDPQRGIMCANWLLSFAGYCLKDREWSGLRAFLDVARVQTAFDLDPQILFNLDQFTTRELSGWDSSGAAHYTGWSSVLRGVQYSGIVSPAALSQFERNMYDIVESKTDWPWEETRRTQHDLIRLFSDLVDVQPET